MSRFFISLDYFFPEADDKPLKEKFIALAGSAFNKFFLCLDKYYGSEHLFPLGWFGNIFRKLDAPEWCISFPPDLPGLLQKFWDTFQETSGSPRAGGCPETPSALLCGKTGVRGTRLTARQRCRSSVTAPCHGPVIRGLKIHTKFMQNPLNSWHSLWAWPPRLSPPGTS